MATIDPTRADHEHAAAAAERLAAIVASSEDAIISKTLDGIITSWNAAAERMFDYTAGEITGQPMYLLVPLALHEQERAILERVARGEKVGYHETVRLTKSGTEL